MSVTAFGRIARRWSSAHASSTYPVASWMPYDEATARETGVLPTRTSTRIVGGLSEKRPAASPEICIERNRVDTVRVPGVSVQLIGPDAAFAALAGLTTQTGRMISAG